MEENIKKTVHYESFYRAAQLMSPKEQLAFYNALDAYRFDGKLLENLPKAAAIAIILAIPNIDADINRRRDAAQTSKETEIPLDALKTKYAELGSMKAVASAFGVSVATVSRKLKDAVSCNNSENTCNVSCNNSENTCNVSETFHPSIEEEIEKEIETENEIEREDETNAATAETFHATSVKTNETELQATPALSVSENPFQNSGLFPTEQAADSPQRAEQPQEKQKQQKSAAFVAPTVEEVAAYCKERNNGIDAEAFVAFYASKGWMVGKNKMKDWRQAVITWEKRSKEQAAGQYSARASPVPVAVQRENSGWHSAHTVFKPVGIEEETWKSRMDT